MSRLQLSFRPKIFRFLKKKQLSKKNFISLLMTITKMHNKTSLLKINYYGIMTTRRSPMFHKTMSKMQF